MAFWLLLLVKESIKAIRFKFTMVYSSFILGQHYYLIKEVVPTCKEALFNPIIA